MAVTNSKSEITWGRHQQGSWLDTITCAGVMLFSPVMVIFYWITLNYFDASFFAAFNAVSELGPVAFFIQYFPRPEYSSFLYYGAWLLLQAIFYLLLPADWNSGQLTPAGHLLKYKTNGLLAWVVTHVLYVAASALGYLDPAILPKHWGGVLFAANVAGFLLTIFVFIKAHLAPTHPDDRKFSSSHIYDFYMGIELNPQISKYFDFKLYTNGRPGIVAWTLIDLSYIAYQYQLHGFVTNSIIVATILHSVYVIDFFYNEDWYLRTIDICHDHFGFYLAWGSFVWLPAIYTLQTQYLARYPVVLPNTVAVLFLFTGLSGYLLFRSVNHQKDLVRRTKGECLVWGKKPQLVRVKYRTKDGLEHDSILLCSGWWGFARHFNYTGDLILSYSMCAVCGLNNLLPWTYAIFMTILLVHRCLRDEERCSLKYGKGWDIYCKRVKWVICPGIY
ncbi:7-dehydrocholesterol reductase [Golovinomyces cichoracearum]|uniref:7-dehydrocholesterol reductase n=1 Tax=Golovinomyces cichoracearum TaxID=62708 RepID=A0A420I9H8_9PEZI|nr:7-dehydrocholesterol reductase [Golovinomyces cichoracearum]